jgi:hypothetical protein
LYTKEVFTYSDQNRLLTHTHQIGTGGVFCTSDRSDYYFSSVINYAGLDNEVVVVLLDLF